MSHDAAGPDRYATASATSRGVPSRPSGIESRIAVSRSGVRREVTRGVSMCPGATALTLIAGAHSNAIDLVRLTMAALLAP